jgi:long-subunit fatty acid transport protein
MRHVGDNILEELNPLSGKAHSADSEGDPGDASARVRKVRYEARSDGVDQADKHDRDGGGRSFGGQGAERRASHEYVNTYHVAIGAQYRVAPPWLLTAGFAYDSSAVSDANRTVGFAVDRQFRYSLGAQYDISTTLPFGAALTVIDAGSASVNQIGGPLRGTIVGDYSPNLIYAIGLNLIKRF